MSFWHDKITKSCENGALDKNRVSRDPSGKSDVNSAFSSTPSPILKRSLSEKGSSTRSNSLSFRHFCNPVADTSDSQPFRIFASTWNVGGKSPDIALNLNDFLPVDDESDIYVLGFQEIVPLNAGNVLVTEVREPASKWICIVDQSLNRAVEPKSSSCPTTPTFCLKSRSPPSEFKAANSFSIIQMLSLNSPSNKILRRDQVAQHIRACNCPSELKSKNYRETCFRCLKPINSEDKSSDEEDDDNDEAEAERCAAATLSSQHRYIHVVSKQMVGIFVTIWAKRELVQHISHLQISCVGRGIMGRLGNKGCISVSMLLYQTSFCFICSHLASGEKEGDELRRNSDVKEILKNTKFRRVCRNRRRRNPQRIIEHDRVIWLGDLNYRIALSYLETKKLLEDNNWDALFEKDQLRTEREAGRVFKGWKEGKIYFAPTYKYSDNSDSYSGENSKSKKNRRTPAWCDRILWRGDGIGQLSYVRGESRLSDHRPVFSIFLVEVEVIVDKLRKELSTSNMKVGAEELLPSPKHSFHEKLEM